MNYLFYKFKNFLKYLEKDIIILFFSMFFWSFGYSLYTPFWTIYLKELGADPRLIGFFSSFSAFLIAFLYLPGGFFADKFNRRKIIILGWLLSTPSVLIFATAKTLKIVFLGIILSTLSYIAVPSFDAYLTGVIKDKSRMSFAFIFVYTFSSSSMLVAPIIGGIIAQNLGIKAVFWLSFCFYLISTFVLLFLGEESKLKDISKIEKRFEFLSPLFLRTIKFIIPFLVVLFLVTLPHPFLYLFLNEKKNLSLSNIGLLGSFYGASVLFFPWFFNKIKEKNIIKTFGTIILVFTLSLVIVVFSKGLTLITFSVFLFGIAQVILPYTKSIISNILPDILKGRGFGVSNFMLQISMMAAPYVSGQIYHISPYLLFVFSIIALLPFGFYFFLNKKLLIGNFDEKEIYI